MSDNIIDNEIIEIMEKLRADYPKYSHLLDNELNIEEINKAYNLGKACAKYMENKDVS